MYYLACIWGEVGVYYHANKQQLLLIESQENYQKKSDRNRYKIVSDSLPHYLSIPLKKGKNASTAIKEVEIAYDEDWVNHHIKTLQHAYQKSPYIDYYIDDIVNLYQTNYKFLFDLNYNSILLCKKWLNLDFEIKFTESFKGSKFIDVSSPCIYMQSHDPSYPFIPNCSILDLIFNLGPESVYYI